MTIKAKDLYHEMRTLSPVLARHSGIGVIFKGDEICTDGENIYYPVIPLDSVLTEEYYGFIKGITDHEPGHERHSAMKRIIPWYSKNAKKGKELLNRLHNAIEDVWMEMMVRREYAGSSENLKASSKYLRKMELKAIEDGDLVPSELPKSEQVSVAINIHKNPEWRCETTNQWAEHLAPNVVDLGKEVARLAREECTCTEDCIILAKKLWDYLEMTPEEDVSSKDFKDKLGDIKVDDEGEVPKERDYYTEEERKAASKGKSLSGSDTSPLDSIKPELKDGLSSTSGYTIQDTTHDKVLTYRNSGSDHGGVFKGNADNYFHHKSMIRGSIMTMKNKIKRALAVKEDVDWSEGQESGSVNTRDLYKVLLGERNVFKLSSESKSENGAVTIMIDLSGSMSTQGKSEVARDCAIALAECLEGTSYSYRIMGYKNGHHIDWADLEEGKYHRKENTISVVFKDYGQPLRTARSAIGNLPDAVGGNNSDYDFVKDELYLISKRNEKKKVVFIISDGCVACETDYSVSAHEKLLIKEIKEYTRKGVTTIGIGLKDSSIKGWCDKAVVVNNVDQLAKKSFKLIEEYLL